MWEGAVPWCRKGLDVSGGDVLVMGEKVWRCCLKSRRVHDASYYF